MSEIPEDLKERGAEWEEITGGEFQRVQEAVKDQKAEDYL